MKKTKSTHQPFVNEIHEETGVSKDLINTILNLFIDNINLWLHDNKSTKNKITISNFGSFYVHKRHYLHKDMPHLKRAEKIENEKRSFNKVLFKESARLSVLVSDGTNYTHRQKQYIKTLKPKSEK